MPGLVIVAMAIVLSIKRGDRGATEMAAGSGSDFDRSKAIAELESWEQQLEAAIKPGQNLAAVISGAIELVERYPAFAPARLLLGHCLLSAARFEPAYEQFEESLRLDPRQPEVHLNAGTVAAQLGRLDDARRHYSEAVGLDTGNSRYRVHLAFLSIKQGRHDEARRGLLGALRIDSSLHQAHAGLSDVFAKQNKIGPALDRIGRALELLDDQEQNTRVIYTRKRAALLRRLNQPDEALAVLTQMVDDMREAALGDPGVSQDLARCWAMMGQPEKAAAHYEWLLYQDPSNDHAAARAAHWNLKAGSPEAARRNLQDLRRINPRSPALPELERELRTANGVRIGSDLE